jgi:hypothetical protein
MTKVIELTADIKNPQADRRSKDWNKLPVIPAGKRFTVHGEYIRSSVDKYAHEFVQSQLAKTILANAKDVAPNSVTEFARVHDVDFSGGELMRILLKLGRIGDADFAAIAEAVKDENF